MKRKSLSLLLALAMVFSLAVPAAAAEAEDAKIVILHTNDVHCGIDQVVDEETGAVTGIGYAGVAAYKAEMEAQYGAENVILVDGGDAIQGGPIGTLSKGSYIVDIMNQVGYDLAVPGNHEFDYGMDTFLDLVEDRAEYPYLCANLTDLEGTPVLEPYALIEAGGVTVGFVGIDTPESFTKSTPTYFQDGEGNYIYSFSQGGEGQELYDAVQAAVDDAAEAGADYVVAVGHLGNEGSTDVWTSTAVIANTTGIDLFIDGHSHETYDRVVQNADGEDVTLAQTGTKLANIGKVVLDPATGEITAELVSGYAQQDPDTAAFVAQVNEEFAGVLQEVVAQTDVALTTLDPVTGERAVRNAETNLGDLCADAYRVLLGADVAFVNGGGVRADIAAGDITYEDIINVHPFGNEACLVETSGQAILDALEMGAHLYPEENGGFLQVSGLSYTIDASVPSSVVLSDEGAFVEVAGEYRVKDVTVGGEPLDLEGTYTLASHNYMLKIGGDGFVMFMDDPLLQDSVMIDNQVLINYIVDELGGVVGEAYADPYGQGRITVINDFTTPTQPVEEEPTEEPEAPADWADVDQDAWYAEAVSYVIENGIMGSTSTEAQVFAPNGTVTRATVYQTLYNMEGKPAVTEAASFADAAGTWYADSAAWAEDTGLTTGDGTGAYAGDRAVTRAELATIFARYAEAKGLATAQGDLSGYVDADQVADWAADSMAVAVGSGILSGKDGGRLDPNGTAIRTELATILLNFSKLTPAEEETAYTEEAVSIEANGRVVPAVVTLPVGEGPFPGVVINHGHGGSKDENVGFISLAQALAEAGIASIRMDFPGCGESTEPFTENTLSNMIEDSNASKDYLVANYPVDADRLGILGYSMGGRLALEVITAEGNPYQAAVILSGVSTPGEEAIAGILPEGMSVEDAIASAEENGSFDYTTQYGQELSLSAEWFTDMLVDPLANIDSYTGPMLVIHGDKDDVVDDATNKLTVAAYPAAEEVIVPDADHGYGFYSDQPEVTAMVEGTITDFFTQHLAEAEEAAYTEEAVSFEVPETDGIPAHTVPAIVTLPAGEGPFPAVVMLHGTGSDKHEAGMGYDHAAPALAEAGIASIRFDFMGNGESTASYSDYCYTSANLDAKAAADYLAGLEAVDAGKLAVMGWSQGGTNALLAAAAYPETFQAVVTWSGAPTLDGSTLFAEGFDAAYETAQAEGVYTMTFDWRDPLEVGTRWFQEVAETDVLAETAKIAAPVLAINGDLDTTVAPENAEAIAQAAPNGQVLMIQGADHTYNVFTETDFHTILETTAATADFLLEALSGEAEESAEGVLTGTVTAVSKYGNITTDLPMADVAAAGLETGDVLTVTVGETTLEAPLGTAYSDVDTGSVIVLADTDTDTLAAAINMGSFSETYGAVEGTVLTFALAEKAGYLEEYEIRNIDSLRTNDRADYASDEVFANFRPVTAGDIAEGVLYRSSSPVNPELGRNAYADDLAEAAGIQTVLNLADSQEAMEAYEGYADTYYATLNVVPLDMGVDFAAADFAAKLKTGLEFLLANEGPYLVHCNEGKDRAGFVTAVLEALMGASLDEIVADYMTSYVNYYHVEEGSQRYDQIAESNIMASLRMVAGLEEGADLSATDLQAAAETYLTETVGLSADQVDALQAVLSGTAAEAAA